ncbi:MAG: 4Fe-4S dicluster domain-containing protein [Thermodesulfovibrio sp.]|nr:4Fe-4S dicluster domain-containing protein [Thermodesulfovibrio sp.]
MSITRREFLAISSTLCAFLIFGKEAEALEGKYATIIDITKCDGCKDEPIPRCVKACKEYNRERFPEPKKPIQPYWPRKTYEDWSDQKDRFDTLTPYNWIFIQRVNIDGKEINIPRRCMHCDSPPCVRECPFGALTKQPEGNTVINDKLCFGGAKCRDVCPWHIPQRQAGVGIYLKILPKYAGGGVMYKCDLCKDRIKKGQIPACVLACQERLGSNAVFTQLMKKLKKKIYTYMEISKMVEHQPSIFQKFPLN